MRAYTSLSPIYSQTYRGGDNRGQVGGKVIHIVLFSIIPLINGIRCTIRVDFAVFVLQVKRLNTSER